MRTTRQGGFLSFLCFATALVLVSSPALSWPSHAGPEQEIAVKDFSGRVFGASVQSELSMIWESASDGSNPILHVRLQGSVVSLPQEFSTARLGFLAGVYKLGASPDVSVDNKRASIMCWNGNAFAPVRNVSLSQDEEDAFAASLGPDFLSAAGSGDFDTLRLTEVYAHRLSSDIFVVEPSADFFATAAGDNVSISDFFWLEPASENGTPLINRQRPSYSDVEVLPIEISVPFKSAESGECSFYLGYIEAVCLERTPGSAGNRVECVYNYRVWEGKIRLGDSGSSNQPEDNGTLDQGPGQEPSAGGPAPTPATGDTGPLPGTPELPPAAPPTPPPAIVAGAAASTPQNGMIWIPGGSYYAGAGPNDPDASSDELPLRPIFLDGFYIDTFPITNAQYWAFVAASGYQTEGTWQAYYTPGLENYPARGISYTDASGYASWCGKRLPTEAEWMAAARGTDSRRYPWGDTWEPLYASLDDYGPVDLHPQNISPFGVREMIGDVWEWTTTDYYAGTGTTEPSGLFVLKGGGVHCSPSLCRISERGGDVPKAGNANYGFRCVMDAPPPAPPPPPPPPGPRRGKSN
jgi:formylglycine-generating enzyme required for sulfatase activity